MFKSILLAAIFTFTSLNANATATTCVFESPEIGMIKAHATYEVALEKVSAQCLAKRSELLRQRHSNLKREDFKERQVDFADDCVNQTKCSET